MAFQKKAFPLSHPMITLVQKALRLLPDSIELKRQNAELHTTHIASFSTFQVRCMQLVKLRATRIKRLAQGKKSFQKRGDGHEDAKLQTTITEKYQTVKLAIFLVFIVGILFFHYQESLECFFSLTTPSNRNNKFES